MSSSHATMRRVPFATCTLTLVACLASLAPNALQFQRDAIAREPWRLATCQLTHWSLDHLLWDAIVFAVLGAICERRGRAKFLATVAIASVVVPLAVHLACPTIDRFRGLSGIDSALFALLLVRTGGPIAAVAIAGFIVKTIVEIATGTPIFAASTFAVVPLSHLAGFAVGIGVGVISSGSIKATLTRPRARRLARRAGLTTLAASLVGCVCPTNESWRPALRRDVIGRQVVPLRPMFYSDADGHATSRVRWPAGTRFVVTKAWRDHGNLLQISEDYAVARPINGRPGDEICVGRWGERGGRAALSLGDRTDLRLVPRERVGWLNLEVVPPDGSAASRAELDAALASTAGDVSDAAA